MGMVQYERGPRPATIEVEACIYWDRNLEAIRRYLGPHGAAQVGQFLGLPGYGGMFAALGWLLRCLQVLERHGLWL